MNRMNMNGKQNSNMNRNELNMMMKVSVPTENDMRLPEREDVPVENNVMMNGNKEATEEPHPIQMPPPTRYHLLQQSEPLRLKGRRHRTPRK